MAVGFTPSGAACESDPLGLSMHIDRRPGSTVNVKCIFFRVAQRAVRSISWYIGSSQKRTSKREGKRPLLGGICLRMAACSHFVDESPSIRRLLYPARIGRSIICRKSFASNHIHFDETDRYSSQGYHVLSASQGATPISYGDTTTLLT